MMVAKWQTRRVLPFMTFSQMGGIKVNLQTSNASQELNTKTRVVDSIYGGLYIRHNIRLLQPELFIELGKNFKWACYLTLSLSMAYDRFSKLDRYRMHRVPHQVRDYILLT